MDYKWRVDILLKDRDGLINCVWVGPETKSTDVATNIVNAKPNDFTSFYGLSDNHNVLVKVGEIVCMDIYPCPDCTEKLR